MLTRVIFVSQRQAETMRQPQAASLVSITDPGRGLAQIRAGWQWVLRCAFHDIDPITFPGWNVELEAMSDMHAAEIARFVASTADQSRRLVVHCPHGISRSAGVAKAVADHYDIAFPAEYRDFNRHVHALVSRALQNCWPHQVPYRQRRA